MKLSKDILTSLPDWRALRKRALALRPDWRAWSARAAAWQPDWRGWWMHCRSQWRGLRAWSAGRWRALPRQVDWGSAGDALRSKLQAPLDLVRRYPGPTGAVAGIAALLLVFSSTMVSSKLERQDNVALISAERARADGLGRKLLEAEALRAADMAAAERRVSGLRDELAESSRAVARLQGELSKANPIIAELREQLAKANLAIAELKQQQAKRRLSYEEKRNLIAALAPYRGQAISVAASYGDEDAKAYAEDLLQVLDAAGWSMGRAPKVSLERFARTPVGVEVTLNEADARAGRLSAATGALINAVRRLGLVDGNAIFMTSDVPAGGVQLRVGHRLRTETANAP
jgi:hypothetical protein